MATSWSQRWQLSLLELTICLQSIVIDFVNHCVFFLEALGARLEEMMHEDKQHVANIVSMVTEECRQKELLVEDEEEDFLDEGSRVTNFF
jgi:hypothetical protein